MKVELFSVLVDTQRLTVGLFKQFEQVELWTHDNGRDTSLELIGVVRHKVGTCSHWALARKGQTLVRCALNAYQTPEADFERQIAHYLKMAQPPEGLMSSYYKERAAVMVRNRDAEQSRFDTHSQAANMIQLFLGLR